MVGKYLEKTDRKALIKDLIFLLKVDVQVMTRFILSEDLTTAMHTRITAETRIDTLYRLDILEERHYKILMNIIKNEYDDTVDLLT